MFALTVPSRTQPNVTYDVRVEGDGPAVCECRGYRFTGHCYHSDALKEFARALQDGPKKRRAA